LDAGFPGFGTPQNAESVEGKTFLILPLFPPLSALLFARGYPGDIISGIAVKAKNRP